MGTSPENEKLGCQEVLAKLDEIRPVINRLFSDCGGKLGIDCLQVPGNFDIRDTGTWFIAGQYFPRAQCSLRYNFIEINLTGIGESIKEFRRRVPCAMESLDDLTVELAEILIHEGVHLSCTQKRLPKKQENLFLQAVVPRLNHDGVKANVHGAEIWLTDEDGESICSRPWARAVNDAFTWALAGLFFPLLIHHLSKLSLEECINLYTTEMRYDDHNNGEVLDLGERFVYDNLPEFVKPYFAGDFFDRFVFALPAEQRTRAIAFLAKDDPLGFLESITMSPIDKVV